MSAKKSNAQRMVKKFGKMADQYQARIDRQASAITRMTDALMTYGDALTEIAESEEAPPAVKSAALQALAMGQAVLAVEEESDGEAAEEGH